MDGEPNELASRDDSEGEFVPRRRTWVRAVAWVAVAALVLGAGFGSALALLAAQHGRSGPGEDATIVSTVIEERGAGSGTVAIEAPPADATALAVRFTCLSAGRFTWGPDPVDNRGSSCGTDDVGAPLWNEFPLPDAPELYITAADDAEWAVQVVYISRAPGEPA